MKALLTRLCAAALLLCLPGLPNVASAQPTGLTYANGTLLCPGRPYNFVTNTGPSGSGCAVSWAIMNGSLTLSNPGPGLVQVSFTDVPRGIATLRTTYTSCDNTAANGQSPTLTVYIRSITNEPLGALTLNNSPSGNIEFGSTAPVTLEVPALAIPRNANEPNPTTILVAGYEWTIPAGWAWPDGAVSTGSPRLFEARSVANPTRIVVTPPASACAGGATPVVRVRAVDTECSIGAAAGYTPTRSAERTLTINCTTPRLFVASNRTPQGGPISLYCGQRLEDEQVQPGFGPIPGNGAFSNFTFSTGGIVGSTGSLNTRTPVLSVSGPGTGTVGLTATYTRNGASTTVSAAPASVTVRPEVTPVVISGTSATPQLNCGSQVSLTAYCQSATRFSWSASNGATVSPAVTTASGQLVTASGNGDFLVTVVASNPAFGCTPTTASRAIILNRPRIDESNNPLQLMVNGVASSEASVICGRPTQLDISGPDFYGNPLPGTIRWIVDGVDYYTGTSLARPLRQSQVTVVLTNDCGLGDYYYWTVNVQGSCSGGGTGGGGGPIDNEPYSGLIAYPNPANGDLTVEQAGGRIRLYNAYGQPVINQETQPGRLQLDTKKLPDGLYFLETRTAKGKLIRRQVQVTH